MSENKRSFWSTVPGLVTGLAGLLTGIVGLVTVLIQLGVVGGKDSADKNTSNGTATTVTTVAGGGSSTTAVFGGSPATTGNTVPTSGAGTFTVPSSLDFTSGDAKEKPLTVKNTSAAGSLTFQQPTVTGPDADRFTVSLDTCGRPVAAGLSCAMKVTFAPNGPLRTYRATLQITAAGAARGAEVAVTGSTLL